MNSEYQTPPIHTLIVSAHELLNLLNKLRTKERIRSLTSISFVFGKECNTVNTTVAYDAKIILNMRFLT